MAKRKKQNNVFKCSCCGIVQYATNISQSLKLFKSYHNKQFPNLKSSDNELLLSFLDDDLIWACDDCFKNKKAIPSIPEKLFTGGWSPLVHFDSELKCQRCQEDFIFSKKEKQFWYEGLMFHIDAQPSNCVECRRVVRKEKKDNTRLSDLLKNKENLSKDELNEVSQIYFRMGKEERMKMYRTLADKK